MANEKQSKKMLVLCTRECFVDRLSEDVVENHLVMYVDIASLIQLSWVSRTWRNVIQKLSTIERWIKECWYMYASGCPSPCDRRMVYLSVRDWADCLWSYDFGRETEVSHALMLCTLRGLGRPMGMLLDNMSADDVGVGANKGAYLDPSQDVRFDAGMFTDSYSTSVVSMPRIRDKVPNHYRVCMRNHRGELIRHPDLDSDSPPLDGEAEFWFEHHHTEQAEGNIYEDEVCSDPLVEWEAYVCEYGGNEEDVPEEIRRQVYHQMDSVIQLRNLGCQMYPMSHCLHAEQMDFGQMKEDPLEWVFLVGGEDEYMTRKVMHLNGFVYFVGVQYDHGPGDAVGWMQSVYHLERYMYYRVWRECTMTLIGYVRRHTLNMMESMELGLSRQEFGDRVQQGQMWAYEVVRGETDTEASVLVSELMFSVDYQPLWMQIHSVQHPRLPSTERLYLSHLLPRYDDMTCNQLAITTDDDKKLVIELDHMLRLECFVFHLGRDLVYGGPDGGLVHMSPETMSHDRTTLRIHVEQATGLFAFAPGWKTEYPLIHQQPFLVRHLQKMCYPRRMNPNETHRYTQQKKWMRAQEERWNVATQIEVPESDGIC